MNTKSAILHLIVVTVAVSSLSVNAFAAEPKLEAVTLDSNGDKMIQWNVGVLGEEAINTVEISGIVPFSTNDDGSSWCGGNAGFGFDAVLADGSEEWVQVDYNLFDDSGNPTDNVITDTATGEYKATLTFDGVKPNLAKAGAIAQLGWWWGSGDGTCAITDIKVNGTSVIGAFAPVVKVSKTQDSDSDIKADIELSAMFDTTDGVIEKSPLIPITTFKADGTDVTLKYDFSQFGVPVSFSGNYVVFDTNLVWSEYDVTIDKYSSENVKIKSIKFDDIEYGNKSIIAVSNENNDALRLTLINEWNDNFANGNAPLSCIQLPQFTTFEVTIAVTAPVEVEPVEPGETEDPSDILPGESSGKPVSPDTGVAVTVIPAALAAAALATTGIVLKKRSK